MKISPSKAALIVFVPLTMLTGLAILNPGNRCATSPDHTDPQLRTQYFDASPQEVLQHIERIVPQLKTYGRSWRIREVEYQGEKIIVHCEVTVLIFTDDLGIEIAPLGRASGRQEATALNVMSQSRVGRSDLGENRRHVLQFLAAVDI